MLNIPEKYQIEVNNSEQRVKFKKNDKTHYKISCSYCGKPIVFIHGKKDKIKKCPHCKVRSPWLLKPKTERLLFELQEEYLSKIDLKKFQAYYEEMKKPEHERNYKVIYEHEKNMDEETLTKLFFIVKNYANSLLKKHIKKKGFYLPPEQFIEKVNQIAFRWYQQFTEKPGFKINDSWAGQIKWKIIEVLYSDVAEETTDSLNRIIESSGGDKERTLEDLTSSFNVKFLFTPQPDDISDPYEQSIDLIAELRKYTYTMVRSMRRSGSKESYRDTLLVILSFLFFLQEDIKREDYIYSTFGSIIRRNSNIAKLQLRRYLRNIHKERG